MSRADELYKLTCPNNVSFISYDGKEWINLYDLDVAYKFRYAGERVDTSQVACIKAFTISNKLNSTVKLSIFEKSLNSIKIDATVTDSYGNQLNTGKVNFNIDNQTVVINVTNGIARLDYSFKNMGEHNITAEFVADNYNPSNTTIIIIMGGILKFNITDTIYGEKITIIPNLTDLNGFKLTDKLNLTISELHLVYFSSIWSS